MIRPLSVRGASWLLPFAALSDFPDGPEVAMPKFDLSLLAPALRRGLSEVTRMFMHTALGALTEAKVRAEEVHVVFASAFGEITAAERLIAQAFDENTSSPARFRNSVHNTGTGLFSISTKNVLPSTAVAAGWDTVAMGLLEADSLLTAGAGAVLLVFAEERVPEALSAEHRHGPLSVAFVLSRAVSGSRGTLSNLRRCPTPTTESPFRGQNHPLSPAILLCQALSSPRALTVPVGDGDEPWCVDVVACTEPEA